jgi:hypothetical protein
VKLSVIIPAHNPRMDYLQGVFDSLRAQTLPATRWELILVDNRSEPSLAGRIDLAWHPHADIVREDMLGLTRARVAGFQRAQGEVCVLVDDDNVLAQDYLEQVLEVSAAFPFVGAWGGDIRPRFEDAAKAPPATLHALLTLRSVEADLWSNDPAHNASTPWGAGLCVRHAVAQRYVSELAAAPQRFGLDLQGQVLLYGGDTDIAYTACRMGMAKGVFARLRLEHLIPRSRCSPEYLVKVAHGRGYSQVLHHHALCGRLPARDQSWAGVARTLWRRSRMSAIERAVDRAHDAGCREAVSEVAKNH